MRSDKRRQSDGGEITLSEPKDQIDYEGIKSTQLEGQRPTGRVMPMFHTPYDTRGEHCVRHYYHHPYEHWQICRHKYA
jgi:hypothetical protein